MLYALRDKLGSRDTRSKLEAISAIAREQRHEFAMDILDIFISDSSARVRGRAAWALGRLHYREAYDRLVVALTDVEAEVREWSAWALGEICFYKVLPLLVRAGEKEVNTGVRRAMFGAVRKLRLEPTRSHITQVARLLKPPETHDALIRRIIEQLASLEWPKDRDHIVALRRQLRNSDPPYFARYMEWVRRKPSIEQAITNPRYVYGDD